MDNEFYEYAEENDDGLTEEELLGFRASLSSVYRGLAEDELEDQLIEFLERMTPTEAESFRRTLANIGQTAAQIGSQLLPTLGTTVGTMISPGIGTAVGGALGNIGGQLLGRAAQRRSPTAARRAAATTAPTPAAPVPEPTAGTIPTGAAAVGTVTGSAAVAQLLQLLQTPQIQQALASARLGQAGAQEMTVGSPENATSAPPAAFLNLVSSVANRAAMEVAQFEPGADFPGYLEGAGIDLANPDERARVLWERLRESEDFRLALGGYGEGEDSMDNAYDEEYEYEFIPGDEVFAEVDGNLAERRRHRPFRRQPYVYYRRRPRWLRRRPIGRHEQRSARYYMRRPPVRYYVRRPPVYSQPPTVVRRWREDYGALDWLADTGLIEGGAPYQATVTWR